MDLSSPLSLVTTPDGLFDLVIVGILLLAGMLMLLAGGIMFGVLPPIG